MDTNEAIKVLAETPPPRHPWKFANVGKANAEIYRLCEELGIDKPGPTFNISRANARIHRLEEELKLRKSAPTAQATTPPPVTTPAPAVAPATATPVDYSKLSLDQQIAARNSGAYATPEIEALQSEINAMQPGLTRDCLQAKLETLKAQLPKT